MKRGIRKWKLRQGGVLLLVLVLGLVGVIILLASVRFVALKFRRTTEQVQISQATSAAESGVFYTLWLLNVVKMTPDNLPVVQDEPVKAAPNDEVVATFTLTFATQIVNGAQQVTVVSEGKDVIRTDLKETVRATLREQGDGLYTVTEWHRDL